MSISLHNYINVSYGHSKHVYPHAIYLNFYFNLCSPLYFKVHYYYHPSLFILCKVRLTACCHLHYSRPLVFLYTCIKYPFIPCLFNSHHLLKSHPKAKFFHETVSEFSITLICFSDLLLNLSYNIPFSTCPISNFVTLF